MKEEKKIDDDFLLHRIQYCNRTKNHALEFSNSTLEFIYPKIEILVHLRYLKFDNNRLKEIPKEIGILIHLEKIILDNNQISKIPKEIGNLTKLEYLYLDNNKISKIPKEIGKLSNLKVFGLSYNQINKIPEEIGKLVNLKTLDLCSNQISKVPEGIRNIQNLKFLDISKNNLVEIFLPEEMLCDMNYFNLMENPYLIYPNKKAQTSDEIKKFFKRNGDWWVKGKLLFMGKNKSGEVLDKLPKELIYEINYYMVKYTV